MPVASLVQHRSTYHHGDLRRQLIRAGVRLCRQGGPEAVALRAVSREVGVAPNAVYAHFATLTDLQASVAREALETMGAFIADQWDDGELPQVARERALARLHAVGRGYILFAMEEPGLFRAAMQTNPQARGVDAVIADGQPNDAILPASQLRAALTELVAQGWVPATRVGDAASACWAVVHGLATLMLRSPQDYCEQRRDQTINTCIDVVTAGFRALKA